MEYSFTGLCAVLQPVSNAMWVWSESYKDRLRKKRPSK